MIYKNINTNIKTNNNDDDKGNKIKFGKINLCLYSINIVCCLWEAELFSLKEKKSSVYDPILLRFKINFI